MSSPEPDAVRQARDWLQEKTGHEPDPDGRGGRDQPANPWGSPSDEWSRPQLETQPGAGPDDLDGPDALDGPGTETWGATAGRSGRRGRGGRPGQGGGDGDDRRSGGARRSGFSADPDADPESVAREIMTRKLAAQDRTRHELATAMAAKNVPEPVAEAMLDRFEELGLVDDDAFAQRWVESRQRRRHKSRLALRQELQAKGVQRDVVDEAVEKVSRDDELSAARSYADKALGPMGGLDRTVRRRRISDRLARRGFGSDVISRVLKDLDV